MNLPPALDAKFKDLVGRYPVKRSALIPMMLFAQDQFGFLSDEMLDEIAKRLDLNMVQVTETLAYYSMLRRKPAGRNHIQVCTNISCMLRGGNELYAHVQKRLGLGNHEVSPTGTFSLEEVECMGACTGAPAMQVNYDFYENLDPDKVWATLMSNEKPGGHGERSVAVGVLDMALWDAVAKAEGVTLWRLLADRVCGGQDRRRMQGIE